MTMARLPADVIDVPQDVDGVFGVLDELARGVAR